MQTAQCHAHANAQYTQSAVTPSPSVPSSRPPHHPLSIAINPHAAAPPRGSSILTPPPSANPLSHSHPPALPSAHVPVHVSPGVSGVHPHSPATRLQNPLHVSPSYSQQEQQRQQFFHAVAESGPLHAQVAPPPPQVMGPGLRPPTLQQQQQPSMTHPTTAMLAPATTQVHPSQGHYHRRTSSLVQVADPARLHGPQQAQPPVSGQAPTRGVVHSAPGTQTMPQRSIQPHLQATLPPSAPVPSQSSTQSQSQAQKQLKEDGLSPSSAISAYRVLQPAKALLEQSWATAIAGVQKELAVVHSEQIQSTREQQRLNGLLQRSQIERVNALGALHDAKSQLRDCFAALQFERKARLQLERKLAEMSTQKCTCGTTAVKEPAATPSPLPPLGSPLPSSTPTTVDDKVRAAPAPPVLPTSPSFTPATKPRELRHERGEETVDGESAPKRRRITPPPISAPSPSAAAPASVTENVPTPGVAEAQTTSEAVIPAGQDTASPPSRVQQSTPALELTVSDPKPVQDQDQSEDPVAAAADPAPAPRKIGIQHIQLVYESVGQTLQCRMCLLRKREVDEGTQVATYPAAAAYQELVGHCELEHEAALDALASMTPADIAEMHQRMQAGR